MEKHIITISREFGSGGRTIGKLVAEHLGIRCYDAELLQKLAAESGFDENYVREAGEYTPGGFLASAFTDRSFGLTNEDLSAIPEQQLHTAGIHVERTGSCIVLHNRVLPALRHSYSCDLRDTVFLIRFWAHSRQGRAVVLVSEENKKSEPFSYREKVRIFMVWCG